MNSQYQRRWEAALDALHEADEAQREQCERLEELVPTVKEHLARMYRNSDLYHTLKDNKYANILSLYKAHRDLCYSKSLVVRSYDKIQMHMRALDTAHTRLVDCDRACRALFDHIPLRERRSYRSMKELNPNVDVEILKRNEALPSFWPEDRQRFAQEDWVHEHREELFNAGFSDWAAFHLDSWARKREDAEREEKEDLKRRSREAFYRERRKSYRRSGYAEAHGVDRREDPIDDLTARFDRSYPRGQNIPREADRPGIRRADTFRARNDPRDRQEMPEPSKDRRQSFKVRRDEERFTQPEREDRKSYLRPDGEPEVVHIRRYRTSFRAHEEREDPRERSEILRTPRRPDPMPRKAEEFDLPRERRQSFRPQPEDRNQGARRRPESYMPFSTRDSEEPRPTGRERAHSVRAGPGGNGGPPPPPIVSMAGTSKLELVKKWRQACEKVLQNKHALLERFPDPPGGIARCTRTACGAYAATRALPGCCQHDLREIFAALLPDLDARRERLCWHPDRFSACANAPEFQAKAREIFHAVNEFM